MIGYVIAFGVIATVMAKTLLSTDNGQPAAAVVQPPEKKKAPAAKQAVDGLMPLTEAWGHFERGERFLAKVKDVRREAVEVFMPDDRGCGLISARCWGTGEKRAAVLAALSVGDTLEVVVRSYDSKTRNLSLVLPECEKIMSDLLKDDGPAPRKHKQAKCAKNNAHTTGVRHARKPDYQLIPKKATVLFDTPNVFGVIGPKQAAHKLSAIEDALVKRGYKAFFFVEYKSLAWLRGNQDTESEVAALEAFCSRANVSMVTGEADLPILQAASVIPDSVIVSRDHFDDYRSSYPEIVGSDRHRSCSSVEIDGKTLLTIPGLRDAIVIEPEPEEEILVCEDRPAPKKPIAPMCDLRKGLLGAGDAYRAKGDLKKAVACYDKVARKVPSVYFEIEKIYADQYLGNQSAQKYAKLGERDTRKTRQCAMRQARIRAERRRIGAANAGWMRAA